MSSQLEVTVSQLASDFVEQVFDAIWAASLDELVEEVARAETHSRPDARLSSAAGPRSLRDAEDSVLRDTLVASLSQHNGNVSAAAKAMGTWRTQVRRWIKRFGLDVQRLPSRWGVDHVPKVPNAEDRALAQGLRARALANSLASHNGNPTIAARSLGISRRTMYRWIRRFGLERYTSDPRDKMRDELVAQLTRLRGNASATARAMGRERRTIYRWMKRFGLESAGFIGPTERSAR